MDDHLYPVSYTLSEGVITPNRKGIIQHLAECARLRVSGTSIIVPTHRASRRAKGVGVVPYALVSRKVKNFLVKQGVSLEVADRVTWKATPWEPISIE